MSSSTHGALCRALPIVAANYAQRFNVPVIIGGTDAKTDGSTIFLPAVDTDNPHTANLLWGYLAHEAAHIRFTDFGVVARSKHEPLLATLFNIIEDVRIEAAIIDAYPGTRHTLFTCVEQLVADDTLSTPPHHATLHMVLCWVSYWGRVRQLRQSPLTDSLTQVQQALQSQLSSSAFDAGLALLQQYHGLSDSADALLLAQLWVQWCANAGVLQQVTSSDTDNTSSENKGDADSERDTDTPAMTLTPQQQAEQQAANAQLDIGVVMQEAISATTDRHTLQRPDNLTMPEAERAIAGSDSLLHQAGRHSAQLRSQLLAGLQAYQLRRMQYRQHGKRLHSRRLATLVVGMTRVFAKRRPRKAPNTSVHLLIDRSSSMQIKADNGHTRMSIANHTALALALALEKIHHVTTTVSYFPGPCHEVMSVLTPTQSAKRRAAFFDQSALGSTPMLEALWYAAYQVTRSTQPRNVVLMVTDGDIAQTQAIEHIVTRAQADGVEFAVITIASNALHDIVPHHVRLDDTNALPQTVFRLMQQLLTH
jgi:hypothetical protein